MSGRGLTYDFASSRARKGRGAAAFTLLEMMLVLAILVIMAAMAAPSLRRTWERQRLKQATELVRAALNRSRIEAMRTGKTQVLQCELGGRRYFAQAWSAGDELINASAEEVVAATQQQFEVDVPQAKQLPDDVLFDAVELKFDTRSQDIEEQVDTIQERGVQWSRPILFYPDGTSSQAELTLINEREETQSIKLRGLTGLASVSEASSSDKLTLDSSPQREP